MSNNEQHSILNRDVEFLYTNRTGGYCSSTTILLNRRKYHSMFVCNIENESCDNYSLISCIDEKIISSKGDFLLATHNYPGAIHPTGYEYITGSSTEGIIYTTPTAAISKKIVFSKIHNRLYVKYRVEVCSEKVNLRVMPLYNYRSIHSLSKCNDNVKHQVEQSNDSLCFQMYDGLPKIFIQCNKDHLFLHKCNWYYDVVYYEERNRGYDYIEDLFSYGEYQVELNEGEEVVFSFSTDEYSPTQIKKGFDEAETNCKENKTLSAALKKAADTFVVDHNGELKILAGYPWFGSWGRDSLIALPGILLSQKRCSDAIRVIDSMLKEMNDGLFINMGKAYNSVDAPMWFFITLQELDKEIGIKEVAKRYYEHSKAIIDSFMHGVNEGIGMRDNGLIWAKVEGKALTWMDAIVDGRGVTPRYGYSVDVNALWYNAVCYVAEMAKEMGDKEFIKSIKSLPKLIKNSFIEMFWDDQLNILADCCDDNTTDYSCRSNQIIATAIRHSMLTTAQKRAVFEVVKEKLLTPVGLRTLDNQSEHYRPVCYGTQRERDVAYHNGTIWVWQLEYYARCGFELFGNKFINEAKGIYNGFEKVLNTYGKGSIAEIYDAEPPFSARGSISQAWSVGALLQIEKMIKEEGK